MRNNQAERITEEDVRALQRDLEACINNPDLGGLAPKFVQMHGWLENPYQAPKDFPGAEKLLNQVGRITNENIQAKLNSSRSGHEENFLKKHSTTLDAVELGFRVLKAIQVIQRQEEPLNLNPQPDSTLGPCFMKIKKLQDELKLGRTPASALQAEQNRSHQQSVIFNLDAQAASFIPQSRSESRGNATGFSGNQGYEGQAWGGDSSRDWSSVVQSPAHHPSETTQRGRGRGSNYTKQNQQYR